MQNRKLTGLKGERREEGELFFVTGILFILDCCGCTDKKRKKKKNNNNIQRVLKLFSSESSVSKHPTTPDIVASIEKQADEDTSLDCARKSNGSGASTTPKLVLSFSPLLLFFFFARSNSRSFSSRSYKRNTTFLPSANKKKEKKKRKKKRKGEE
eukprot:TRINITY_DN3769_c0_g1_i1.p1 TRINITY_DN3769_c0_g1~~TRINITY_DN3769_c0_g1_i1.p1  ORF type:complete len:155 (-),score=21.60 TRINITY_DN3769_c0_g1_i1:589-1053(-)